MAELDVALVAADREVWTGAASTVITRTTEGDLGILPGHESMLSVLVAGLVEVRPAGGGETLLAAVDGGFLSVSDDRVSVLAESVTLAADIDETTARRELQEAEGTGGAEAIRRAQARLSVATGQGR